VSESIFSTYSTGENRVTASLVAVLRSLALPRIERLLGALMGASEFQLVHFINQPSKGGKGVPDAEIGSSCRILLETKLERNALNRSQLERHLERLDETKEAVRQVLVLTPDDTPPALIGDFKDERLIWSSFVALNQAVDELLNDEKEVISEREAFLLREMQKMLLAEGLLGSAREVLVVPARHAWNAYKELHAYCCQAGRAFQLVKYIAFYSGNQIHPLVPRIVDGPFDHVVSEQGKYSGRLGELVNQMMDRHKKGTLPSLWDWGPGTLHKVFLLSTPDAPETVKLKQPIKNDTTSESGQPTAFAQNQRYISLDGLRKATKTSELGKE
jgi:hypothetical protein